MICDVERKPSFCALKSFKVGFTGVRSNVPFFREICVVNLSCYFFHKWDSSRMCGKQRHFYPPVFLDFSIALETIIMMNVLPSNTARGATTRTQPEWTRELPHRLEECCHAAQILFGRAFIVSYCCWIILLFHWCCRIYLILINIVVNNEVLRFVIECRVCFYLVEEMHNYQHT